MLNFLSNVFFKIVPTALFLALVFGWAFKKPSEYSMSDQALQDKYCPIVGADYIKADWVDDVCVMLISDGWAAEFPGSTQCAFKKKPISGGRIVQLNGREYCSLVLTRKEWDQAVHGEER